jgi:nucleoside phosphorylase
MGIAGNLAGDRIRLGDVIVPSRVTGYEVGEAIESDSGALDYIFRPTQNQTDFRLLDSARALYRDKSNDYKKWRQAALDASSSELQTAKLPERLPELHIHENDQLASGNFVVKSARFRDKIRNSLGNADICAVDMESKALFDSVRTHKKATNALIVRGISDFADRDKSQSDQQTKGVYRHKSARAAALFIAHLIERRFRFDNSTGECARAARLDLTRERYPLLSCQRHAIALRDAGAQMIALDRLLEMPDGSVELELTVSAKYNNVDVSGASVSLMV